MAGLVELDVERKRIEKEVKTIESRAEGKRKRLKNATFRSKAPAEVIAQEEGALEEAEASLRKWSESLKQLE